MQQSEKQALDRKQPWVGQPRGSEDDEINLVELLYRLIEKWKIIALASLLGALIAAVYTFCFITPMYTATSKLYVVNTKDSAINLSDLQIGNYLASDYTEVFSNWHVHEMVLQRLGLDYTYSQLAGMVSVKNPKDTRRISFLAVPSGRMCASGIPIAKTEYTPAVCMSVLSLMIRRKPRTWQILMRRWRASLSL